MAIANDQARGQDKNIRDLHKAGREAFKAAFNVDEKFIDSYFKDPKVQEALAIQPKQEKTSNVSVGYQP